MIRNRQGDGSGNRETETVAVGTIVKVTTFTYDNSNKLTSTQSVENGVTTQKTDYTYDSNGNMLEKRVTPYDNGTSGQQIVKLTNTYDRFNQLIMSITDDGKTVINTYNGEGLRIAKEVNGVVVKYLYEGDKIVAEYDASNHLKAQNIQGINLLMRVEPNASYYYMYNGHADVTALLNKQTNNVDATYYYDAFGTILSQTGTANNSFLYAGYQYDAETGLYYLNARMYDSTIARFIQEDTYRGNPNDPLSLNLYTYCANNPLIYHDPSGHSLKDLWHNTKKAVKKTVNSVKATVSNVKKAVKMTVNNVKKSYNNSSIGKAAKAVVTAVKNTPAVKSASQGLKTVSNAYNKTKEIIHTGLDVAGMLPVVGEVCDAVNAVLYIAEGDFANAALSATALIPVVGIGATGAKLVAKYGDEVVSAAKTLAKTDFLQNGLKTLKSTSGSVNLGAFTKAFTKNTDELAGIANDEAMQYYSNLVEKLNVKTGANQAVFYSGQGNRKIAEQFAIENGKLTLEMTPGGKYIDSLKLFDSGSPLTGDQATEIWGKLSKCYADNASGTAYGYTQGSRPKSIFNMVEYPALETNKNIVNVITEFFNK